MPIEFGVSIIPWMIVFDLRRGMIPLSGKTLRELGLER